MDGEFCITKRESDTTWFLMSLELGYWIPSGISQGWEPDAERAFRGTEATCLAVAEILGLGRERVRLWAEVSAEKERRIEEACDRMRAEQIASARGLRVVR